MAKFKQGTRFIDSAVHSGLTGLYSVDIVDERQKEKVRFACELES